MPMAAAKQKHHHRSPTFPLYNSTRKKPRRWPLVLRFYKGAIHNDIFIPIVLFAGWAALITYLDVHRGKRLSLPVPIISSLSIVVGLMLVFRNNTSYDRFWRGNLELTALETNLRNLTRVFLCCSHAGNVNEKPTDDERADTERAVRILLALIYATKNHLRAEWGRTLPMLLMSTGIDTRHDSTSTAKPEYAGLLPPGTRSFEDQGLGLLLQLACQIEGYIKRAVERNWFHPPQAAQMTVQLNNLTAAYGNMETIHLTPIPVAYLIHQRQVLACFCAVLPFALVKDMAWWSVLMEAIVVFTLYGIEAIGQQLEDPFGYDKNDIKVDSIVEDLHVETSVLLEEWRRGSEIFSHAGVPRWTGRV